MVWREEGNRYNRRNSPFFENSLKNYLLLINGLKGSEKSTLLELLKDHLDSTEFCSLDGMRQLVERTNSLNNDNKKAFDLLVAHLKDTFSRGKNGVVDSGLSEERIHILEEIAKEYGVKLHKFSLIAPYEVLYSRVQARDKSKGRTFYPDRFDYTFHAQQAKSFEDFSIIDSSKLSPQEIYEIVHSKITQV